MSFSIALSGINAINSELDAISNNIANSGTYGFKSSRANFASVYAGSQAVGTEVSSLQQSVDVGGDVMTTGRDLDASIAGRGFFAMRDGFGALSYTRVGVFTTDKDGYVVDTAGRKLQGYGVEVDAAGRPIPGAAMGALGDLQVSNGQIAAQASNVLTYAGNMSSEWNEPGVATFDRENPLSYNSSVVSSVYDSLGSKHSVTQYFVKTDTNEVTIHYTVDGADVPTTHVMGFAGGGQLATLDGNAAAGNPAVFANLALNLGTPTGANPLVLNINYNNSTQYAGEATTRANTADGYASGTLASVALDKDGSVIATYSNGKTQKAGTVAVATFADEMSLNGQGDRWTASSASGTALYSAPGSGMAGTLSVGSIEQSNVDMTSQLVSLMSSQRNYQANSKVISTQNEMLQSLFQAL
ncbi:MAG TPA: flagellar hook-basal body complex protein [Ideonella sp.]|nr:flagellar hook-basal body complex protein [Ideonella sp.]